MLQKKQYFQEFVFCNSHLRVVYENDLIETSLTRSATRFILLARRADLNVAVMSTKVVHEHACFYLGLVHHGNGLTIQGSASAEPSKFWDTLLIENTFSSEVADIASVNLLLVDFFRMAR